MARPILEVSCSYLRRQGCLQELACLAHIVGLLLVRPAKLYTDLYRYIALCTYCWNIIIVGV